MQEREWRRKSYEDDSGKQPYCVMDILPIQVPANGSGQYFKVEQYNLNIGNGTQNQRK